MSEFALEVDNLAKHYASFCLDDISFKLGKGRIMGFIGRNGAGKTTTLKAILNLIHRNNGEVKILDKDVFLNEKECKQQIGFVLGGVDYYLSKKIKTIAQVTSKFYKEWDYATYYNYLKEFELDENKRVKDLSEGMKVKFNLALALSHKAKVLILDEPTSGLDPISRDEILELFELLVKREGVSILFSTHITSDLEKCANDITYIKKGKMVYTGTKKDFLSKYNLIKDEVKNVDEETKDKCISYRENEEGMFEGLIPSNIELKSVKFSKADLETIMIFCERNKTL